MTDYKRRTQDYYDGLKEFNANAERERIFYRQSEKNALVSNNLDEDESLKNYVRYKNTFRPKIIAKDPSTFCFFGSAKSRYENSIYNILNYYPFDGTQQETINWLSSSSTLDVALIEKHWPSSVGHIAFLDREYINFFAGPQKIAGSKYTGNLQKGETPLKIDYVKGNTVEFWLKKSGWIGGVGDVETVFQVGSHPSHTDSKRASFRVALIKQNSDTGSPFFIEYLSGSSAVSNGMILTQIGGSDRNHDAYIDDKWHHYAFRVFQSSSSPPNSDLQSIYADMFMDGKKIHSLEQSMGAGSTPLTAQDSFMAGTIGAPLASTEGTFSGSIDDFRFWKGQRTNREINRYYDKKIYASSVELEGVRPDYVSRLGAYYKFNKKSLNNSEADSLVLDYSGNDMTAKINRYNSASSRSATSAIDLSEASKNTEIPDISLLETDPSVISLRDDLIKIAKSYDKNNHNSIFKMVPSWANDPHGNVEANEKSDFYILLNMIAEEFDEIKLNVDSIRSLTNRNFDSNHVSFGESGKEITSIKNPGKIDLLTCSDTTEDLDIYPGNRIDFPQKNLEKLGFKITARPLELNIRPEDDFENIIGDLRLSIDPTTTKRLIMDNVLIAANSIIKKKGTERSLDEMMSCWGIDRNIVSLNTYGQNSEIDIDKSFKSTATVKARSFDFSSSPETVFFMSAPAKNSTASDEPESQRTQDSLRYIPGQESSVRESNITFEGNFIFPTMKKDVTYDLETSVFGIREIDKTEDKLVTPVEASNKAWLQVSTQRPDASSPNAKFILKSPLFGSDALESSYINNVYDNSNWNLNLRVHRVGNEETRFLTESSATGHNSWEVVFSGHNYILDSLQNSFTESKTITQDQYNNFIQSNRHVFVGAEKENITGSLQKKANFKFLNFKVWNSSLSDSEVQELSQNLLYWGRTDSTKFATGVRDNVPKSKDLILKIDVSNYSSVPSTGILELKDFTSGSMNNMKSVYGDTLGAKYPFSSTLIADSEKEDVLQVEFLTIMRDQEPELIRTNEEVRLRDNDLSKFDVNSKDESRIISFEKSIYKQISREMIDFLSGVQSLNNLIGAPCNKYRPNYKLMDHFRQVFYSNVENESQFERFTEYYRWIDYSLGSMLEQIVPATAQSNTKIQNVIESHVLERNKYQHKFPLVKSFDRNFEVQARNTSNASSWPRGSRSGAVELQPVYSRDADDSNDSGRQGYFEPSSNNSNSKG